MTQIALLDGTNCMSNFAWREWGCTCLYPIQFGHSEPACKFRGTSPHALPEGCTQEWVDSADKYIKWRCNELYHSPEQVKNRQEWADKMWGTEAGQLKVDVLRSSGPNSRVIVPGPTANRKARRASARRGR